MARIIGTTDNEILTGTEGADHFVVTQASGNDTITDFQLGTDIIDLSCFGKEISWNQLSAKIETVANPGAPSQVIGIRIDLTEWGGGSITLDGVTSVNALTQASFKLPAVKLIEGTDGYETLQGSSGMDRIYGYGDGDILDGGGGDDVLYGGEGWDLLVGGRGDDELYGEEGRDTLDGGSGDDKLDGGEGDDTLDGAAGDDEIIGGLGNDTLWGDRCDTEGADTFVFAAGHGDDTIKDFNNGLDKIQLSAFSDISALSDMNAMQEGPDVVIDLASYGGGTITLENVHLDDLDNADFIFSGDSVDGV